MMQILQPPGWAGPRGFSNGIAVRGGTTVYLAGQVGWTGAGAWVARDFAGQFRQALKNILEVLAQAGGRPEHIVRPSGMSSTVRSTSHRSRPSAARTES